MLNKMSSLGKFFKSAAEGNARDAGCDFAGRAANACRGIHLGIERFELRWSAVHKQEHDRFIAQRRLGVVRQSLLCEELRKCEPR